jgi:voltage-gated potassium channel
VGRLNLEVSRADESQVLRNILRIIGILILLFLGGTLGYRLIEGWAVLDCLYMTVITLATVGFQEVHPLSPAGKVFTGLLIIVGIGLFTYSGGRLVSVWVEGEIKDIFAAKRRRKMIERMIDHHVVCGGGRVGAEVVRELHGSGVPVVVVDRDPQQLKRELELLDIPFVLGEATNADVLEEAGVSRARSLVVCLPNDADNVYICLTAKSVQPDLFIIARANARDAEDRLKKAGASRVISPYSLSAHRMALLCVRPAVTRFLDRISVDFRMDEIKIPSDSALAGKELKESGIRKSSDAMVIGIVKTDGSLTPNPGPGTKLEPEDVLVLVGREDQLQRAQDWVNRKQ